jgi:hypothetical protein
MVEQNVQGQVGESRRQYYITCQRCRREREEQEMKYLANKHTALLAIPQLSTAIRPVITRRMSALTKVRPTTLPLNRMPTTSRK